MALEANYVDNDFDGVFKVYYKKGNIKIKREHLYVNRNLEGPAKVYYENGVLKYERFFKKGKSIVLKKSKDFISSIGFNY